MKTAAGALLSHSSDAMAGKRKKVGEWGVGSGGWPEVATFFQTIITQL